MASPVSVTKFQVKSHGTPDEVRALLKTRAEAVQFEGATLGRFNSEPGWRLVGMHQAGGQNLTCRGG